MPTLATPSMRIRHLAQKAKLPIGTVKFYLREGLLPAGHATGATAALYDEGHLTRLRLIRALITSGGLSIADVGVAVAQLESPELDQAVVSGIGLHHHEVEEESLTSAMRLLQHLGWSVDDDTPQFRALAGAIEALESIGAAPSPHHLKLYAVAADALAREDAHIIDAEGGDPPSRSVITTVLWQAVFNAMRRLALEHHVAATTRVPHPRTA